MSKRHATIPLSKIQDIVIYENTNHLSFNKIIEQEKPDYAITGTFYNMTKWTPLCHLKVNGEVKVNDGYVYRGFSWDSPVDFDMRLVPTNSTDKANYIACLALIANNVPIPDKSLIYNADVGGKRGRSGIGLTNDEVHLFACTDGVDGKTPETFRDYVYDEGCTESFIMLDGGTKVNYYAQGDYMKSSITGQNFILIYLKDENEQDKGENEDVNITQQYITKNPRYTANEKKTKTGYMQHSTGTPGAKATAFINNWNSASCQAETEFVIDDTGIYQLLPIGIRSWHCGGSGNNTHVGCEVCEPQEARLLSANWLNLSKNGSNNTTWAVTRLQQELTAWGYDPNGIDGIFGSGCESAVKKFQQDNGLSVDGIVGKATLAKLQTRSGSYLKYDAQANQDYFKDVYQKAVYTCAYVLNKLGVKDITTTNVLSHAEGYAKGIASNHADVGHWWPEHGKTMDDFRADVKSYLSTGILPYKESQEETTDGPRDNASSWAQESWVKAWKKGTLDGKDPKDALTREQFAVVLDRLGLLD